MIYGKYDFICRFEEPAILPYYKGSTFRGAFGYALKRVVCVLKHQECGSCILKTQCLYPVIFETPTVRKPPDGAKFASVPHPFVIEPPLTSQTRFIEGSPFNFSLILFGNINQQLPYFIYAFDQMGKGFAGKGAGVGRGRFSLTEVRHRDRIIYRTSEGRLDEPDAPDDLSVSRIGGAELEDNRSESSASTITASFDTPLRFKRDNRLSRELPFHELTRLMLRRATALLTTYGDGPPALDYRGLIQRAERIRIAEADLNWHDWRRYSNRQEQDMNLGGLIGKITYEGDLEEFAPLMTFAAAAHIGKQTTFGLGKVSFT